MDDTFPNTVVVTIDATHHMRMSPGLMRHVQSQLHGANHLHTPSPSSSTDQSKLFFLDYNVSFLFHLHQLNSGPVLPSQDIFICFSDILSLRTFPVYHC